LVLILPLIGDLNDFGAELMANNNGVFRDIIGNADMLRALLNGFICRHAHAVGNDLDEDLSVLQFRKIKLFQPNIILTVQANSFCFDRILLLQSSGAAESS
jgi:hypothetical protein